MEVSSPAAVQSPGANGVAPAPFPTIDPERIVDHLAAVCQIALGASKEDLEQPGNLLHKSRYAETVSRCTRFANDTQNVLYIQKDIAHSSTVENGSDTAGESRRAYLVGFMPCDGLLTPSRSADLQLHTLYRDRLLTDHRCLARLAQGAPAHRPEPTSYITDIHY